jgi:hypothetical protein
MRRRGVKLEDAPDTVAMGHSGKCKSCVSTYIPREPADADEEPALPKHEDPDRMGRTVSDLEAWMSRFRGVPREATNPIKYTARNEDAA